MISGSEIVEYCNEHQIKAVIFDLYGTLLKKPSGLNPYKKLLKALYGNDFSDHFRRVLTEPLDLGDVRLAAESVLDDEVFSQIRNELIQEIMGIQPYPQSQSWIDQCKAAELKVAVCSNLAMPYGRIAKERLAGIDSWVFSYEVGFKKPESGIYQTAISTLNLLPDKVLMIGDSIANDVLAPRNFGMHSIHISHT